ncbi:MAG: homoserine dehydrogenase [Deltaproteobacteria bacterium]
MKNIAVLGYGIVGSGVVEVLKKNREGIAKKAGDTIQVRHILDIRDFPDSPDKDLMTKNPDDIFDDSDVSIVVETIGGINIAYEFTKKALMKGKSVITSNKELVATYGPELMRIAKEKGVYYKFEASVGGGIPIIKPLYECFSANQITSIAGILNGTTNYILSSMVNEGKDFESALKDAQLKGYAEANPSDDIEGKDSCRKIAILSSIAYGEYVDYKEIPTEGITKITVEDLKIAELLNLKIKLIGFSKKENGKIIAKVCPCVIDKANALANVEDVFNAILVSGDSIGDVMFYGRGAGKLPTASAVVNDVIDVVKYFDSDNIQVWNVSAESNFIKPEDSEAKYFVRIKVRNKEEAKKYIVDHFGNVDIFELAEYSNQLMFKTLTENECEIIKKIQALREIGSVRDVLTSLRILE